MKRESLCPHQNRWRYLSTEGVSEVKAPPLLLSQAVSVKGRGSLGKLCALLLNMWLSGARRLHWRRDALVPPHAPESLFNDDEALASTIFMLCSAPARGMNGFYENGQKGHGLLSSAPHRRLAAIFITGNSGQTCSAGDSPRLYSSISARKSLMIRAVSPQISFPWKS